MGTSIKIKGTNYPIKFGTGAFKILGKKWNFPGPQSVMQKIATAFPKQEGEEITFEGMEILSEVVIAGLKNADKDYPDKYSPEDIESLVILNPEALQVVSEELVASFPGAGNAEPRSKARKAATTKKK